MLFHARGSAPCIPGAEPKRRREQGRTTRPAGGRARLVAGSTCRRCTRRGGLPALSPPYPAISFAFCPLSPRPPSPAGKGVPQSLFRRGLRPRHPCTEPLAALTEPSSAVPGGGLPSLSPPYPAISFAFCPLSPRPPSPAGKGETKVFSCKGLRPLHPWG